MLQNRDTGAWLLLHYRQGAVLTRDVVEGADRIGQLTSFFKSVEARSVLNTQAAADSRFVKR